MVHVYDLSDTAALSTLGHAILLHVIKLALQLPTVYQLRLQCVKHSTYTPSISSVTAIDSETYDLLHRDILRLSFIECHGLVPVSYNIPIMKYHGLPPWCRSAFRWGKP